MCRIAEWDGLERTLWSARVRFSPAHWVFLSPLTNAHGTRPERDKIFQALLAALTTTDQDHAILYADAVLAALPQAARQHLEVLMTSATYEYQSDFARRYFHQGKAEGEARALLAVLAARGIDVPDTARQRITQCTDPDQLETWIRRATTVPTLDEVFAAA